MAEKKITYSQVLKAGQKVCVNCKSFVQHYRDDGGRRYNEVHCGHCLHGKARSPGDKGCENFISIDFDRYALKKAQLMDKISSVRMPPKLCEAAAVLALGAVGISEGLDPHFTDKDYAKVDKVFDDLVNVYMLHGK